METTCFAFGMLAGMALWGLLQYVEEWAAEREERRFWRELQEVRVTVEPSEDVYNSYGPEAVKAARRRALRVLK